MFNASHMVFIFFYRDSCEGLFTQKNPHTTPNKSKKSEKTKKSGKSKKSAKSENNPNNKKIFFWGLKIRTPYLGVKNPSILVFKSFFIYKILVPKKIRKKSEKSEKIQNNQKKMEKKIQ